MELLELDISRNPIGEGGCAALCDLLLAPNCVLQTLDVSEAQLFSSGCTVLMGALSHNATIRTLLLSSNAIGPQGGTAIAEALLSDAACGALTSLDVSNNDLDSAGFAAVAHAAAATPRLHTLDLSHNNVAHAAAATPRLHTLNLSHNNAGAAGLEALGEAYEHLAFLSRGGPFLDSRGGPVHSGGGLSRVPHLAELNLAFNNAPCVSARARFGAEVDGPASGAAGAVGRRARRAGEEADDGAGRWLETMLRLGDGIAIHLHNALSQGGGAGLEELRLRGNALSLDGLTRVGEVIASNMTLLRVHMTG
ncbi:hypothetical protein T484DRAFT_1780592 [Baffinella frigidus]|nr:hypothetical protein T484DRAFT_1780592 [Cryptophyta sp. CCMP2293]